ncbi:CLN3 protein [Ancylostoma caninum]|uniref:Battenin n=1 Tax=Ancylostoma caninum TaxID=29170 RepID=A0A368GYN7_ANCCA|nr:CLN3 protein [Ancylostoma caninum]
MLSAAKDILDTESGGISKNGTHACREEIIDRQCQQLSTGAVLLADIIPALVVKVTAPLYIQMIPFGLRHFLVVMAQMLSFVLVASSSNVKMALLGVIVASWGSGLGEISYLALASYFDSKVVSMWSSGTGGAGIIGAMTYAVLTDPLMLHFTPRIALYCMLIIPMIFAYTFWFLLQLPPTVHRVEVCKLRTYIVPKKTDCINRSRRLSASSESDIERPLLDEADEDVADEDCINRSRRLSASSESDIERPLLDEADEDVADEDATSPFTSRLQRGMTIFEKLKAVTPLFKYMIPLIIVYFAEYFINQGLLELLEFDCSHGFNIGPQSQYRWYQVLYQVGVFVSRSSSDIIALPGEVLPLLALLQVLNATVLYFEALNRFMSHILLLMCVIVYEGLLGGASYVNTFRVIHEEVPADRKEFSMGFVSISDTFGILLAGFTAIPVHNIICEQPL